MLASMTYIWLGLQTTTRVARSWLVALGFVDVDSRDIRIERTVVHQLDPVTMGAHSVVFINGVAL